jgi:hypothetical protein
MESNPEEVPGNVAASPIPRVIWFSRFDVRQPADRQNCCHLNASLLFPQLSAVDFPCFASPAQYLPRDDFSITEIASANIAFLHRFAELPLHGG